MRRKRRRKHFWSFRYSVREERERDCFGGVFLLLALCVGVRNFENLCLSLSLFYKLRVLRISLSLSLSFSLSVVRVHLDALKVPRSHRKPDVLR